MIAILRLARRNVRRNPGRSAVVVALVALPVAALSFSLLYVGLWTSSDEEQQQVALGRADARIQVMVTPGVLPGASSQPSEEEVRERLGLPDDAQLLPTRAGDLAVPTGSGDEVQIARWEEVDLSAPLMRDRFRLVEGRLPEAPGEALAVDDLARTGERLAVALPALDLEVVGHVRSLVVPGKPRLPLSYRVEPSLVVAPGTMPPPVDLVWSSGVSVSGPAWYVGDVGDSLDTSVFVDSALLIEGRRAPSVQATQLGLFAAGALAFLWCGLVAASALSIGARRRRRELGLLAVNGADPAMLRRAIAADGVVLGGIGALLGLLGGWGVGALFTDRARSLGNLTGGDWNISPLVVAAVAMGWASAAAAGSLAGRGLARQPVLDLLAGRSPRPKGAPGWFGAGAVAFGVCALLTVWATTGLPERGPARYVIPVSVVVAGVVAVLALATGGIRVAPRLAGRSVIARLAARDLDRFGARTAAATGAIALTLTAATAAAVLEHHLARVEYNDHAGAAETTSADRGAVDLGRWDVVSGGATVVRDGRLVRDVLRPEDRAEAERLAAEAGAELTALTVAGSGVAACAGGPLPEPQSGLTPDGCYGGPTVVRVPDELLGTLPAELAQVLTRGEVAGWVTGWVGGAPADPYLLVGTTTIPVTPVSAPEPDIDSPVTQVALRGFVGILVPEQRWSPVLEPTGRPVLVLDGRRLSPEAWEELQASVREAVDAPGWETFRTKAPSSVPAVAVASVATVVLVLSVLALALVLVRIESRDEERVLRTQGASPGAAGAVAAWRAALMTWIGAVPAVAVTSLLALLVGVDRIEYARPQALAAILVGLPLLAALVFGLAGRRAPRPATV